MDAFSYFLTSLAALNFLIALLAFLLGLLLGWLIWAKYKQLHQSSSAEITHLKQELNQAKSSSSAYAEANQNLEVELEKAQSSLNTCLASKESLESELKNPDTQLLEQPLPFITEPVEKEAPQEEPEAKAYFSSAIASGLVKEDDQYGLLYTQAPDEVDDLTRIKGVAGVLNKALNDFGVYKYRQIAIWTPEICDIFSEKLSFKGRVERDDWVGQCKQFHEEKYGEKI